MEVRIVDVCEDLAKVNSEIGVFYGVWCSSAPIVSRIYHVEIDCDEIIDTRNIEFSNIDDSFVDCVDKTIYLTGLVEQVDDKILFLRLYRSLVMLNITSESEFKRFENHFVRISVKELKLFDIGV